MHHFLHFCLRKLTQTFCTSFVISVLWYVFGSKAVHQYVKNAPLCKEFSFDNMWQSDKGSNEQSLFAFGKPSITVKIKVKRSIIDDDSMI